MKLCMDCEHFRVRWDYKVMRFFGSEAWCEFARCQASERPRPDPVCGRSKGRDYGTLSYCDSMRREREACGPEGDLFKQRAGDSQP